MKTADKVDIIVILYKPDDMVKKLVTENISSRYNYIIVSNSRVSPSFLRAIKKLSNVRHIHNDKNIGFASAMNQAINLSRARYIFALNPDVKLCKGYLENLIKVADSDENIGVVTGCLYDYYDKKTVDSCGAVMYNTHAVSQFRTKKKNSCRIFLAGSTATLYRRSMLEDIKIEDEYYDSDFFCYMEDIDLELRANLFGWSIYYTPRAVAYHIGQCSAQSIAWIKKMTWKNRWWSIIKNDSLLNILLDLPFILAFDLYYLLRYPYCYSELPKLMVKLPKMLKKRKIIQKRIKISNLSLRRYIRFHPFPSSR